MIARQNIVVLEMSTAPFFLSDGRQVLRSGDWRKFVTFKSGAMVGVSIGSNSGRVGKEMAETWRKLGVRVFRAGEWESEFTTGKAQIDGLPEIRNEVWESIQGAAVESPVPCQ